MPQRCERQTLAEEAQHGGEEGQATREALGTAFDANADVTPTALPTLPVATVSMVTVSSAITIAVTIAITIRIAALAITVATLSIGSAVGDGAWSSSAEKVATLIKLCNQLLERVGRRAGANPPKSLAPIGIESTQQSSGIVLWGERGEECGAEAGAALHHWVQVPMHQLRAPPNLQLLRNVRVCVGVDGLKERALARRDGTEGRRRVGGGAGVEGELRRWRTQRVVPARTTGSLAVERPHFARCRRPCNTRQLLELLGGRCASAAERRLRRIARAATRRGR
jgi:hypothetical protein|tara:strand:+ start:2941 stop:3786 length:846 start_codon:yes stop_codon:yes gene_type:complete